MSVSIIRGLDTAPSVAAAEEEGPAVLTLRGINQKSGESSAFELRSLPAHGALYEHNDAVQEALDALPPPASSCGAG